MSIRHLLGRGEIDTGTVHAMMWSEQFLSLPPSPESEAQPKSLTLSVTILMLSSRITVHFAPYWRDVRHWQLSRGSQCSCIPISVRCSSTQLHLHLVSFISLYGLFICSCPCDYMHMCVWVHTEARRPFWSVGVKVSDIGAGIWTLFLMIEWVLLTIESSL